jgi:hypothetical protein
MSESKVKQPDKYFAAVAGECISDGTFDSKFTFIVNQLKVHKENEKEMSYWTRVLHAFLFVQGGSYSVSTDERGLKNPPSIARVRASPGLP